MTGCKYSEECPLFDVAFPDKPNISEIYRDKYCKGDWRACARFEVARKLGPGKVPGDLFPNQHRRLPDIFGELP